MTVVAEQTRPLQSRNQDRNWITVSLRTTFCLILVIGLYMGSRTQRADEAVPDMYGYKITGESRGKTVRVGTFNIHSGKGTDGITDLDRIAELIKPLDLVGLNEVAAGFGHNQVRQLSINHRRIGLFGPTEKKWGQHHFGNGLLSRIDVERGIIVPLTSTQNKYRNVVLTRFQLDGETVHVLVCHIDRVQDRKIQLRNVFGLFQSMQSPAILMGDLNTRRDDELLQKLFRDDESITDVLADDRYVEIQNKHIDWIITKGFETLSAEMQRTVASDHPLLWAELKLESTEDK